MNPNALRVELPEKVRTRACFNQLLGAVAISEHALDEIVGFVNSVGLETIWKSNESRGEYPEFSPAVYHLREVLLQTAQSEGVDQPTSDDQGPPPYINFRGTAVIPVNGPLAKQPTSLSHAFGGSSTVGMRKALQIALADKSVERIMFHIDSPGGTVAGTGDLGDDIFMARSIKPIASYIEDLGASAAYWIASQTSAIYASPHAEIGSIGVIHVIHDISEAAKKQGVQVHVFKSGPYKGGPIPGAPLTDSMKERLQADVDRWHNLFVSVVARGRNLQAQTVQKVSDGRLFLAAEAKQNNLVDHVASFAASLADFSVRTKKASAQLVPVATSQGGNSALTPPPTIKLVTYITDSSALPPQEVAPPRTQETSDAGAKDANQLVSNTEPSIITSEGPGMPEATHAPADKPGGAPVTLSAEQFAALQKGIEAGVRADKRVEQLLDQMASKEAASLDQERERLLADYTGFVDKTDVAACKDVASLRALESVARKAKTGTRSPPSPSQTPASAQPAEFDAWAAHEDWKAKTGGTILPLVRTPIDGGDS